MSNCALLNEPPIESLTPHTDQELATAPYNFVPYAAFQRTLLLRHAIAMLDRKHGSHSIEMLGALGPHL
jgi:hypothetical protein